MKKNPAKLTCRDGRWSLLNESSGTKFDESSNKVPRTSPPGTFMRHPSFYFDNILVAILIENTMFNVHKYQLAKSEAFSDMFNMPKPEGHEPEEGSSPEHPIVLEGVAASDFAALLTVLYASLFSSNQPTPEASLVIPAFQLANMFGFLELRAYLLPLAQEKLDDVDKILFAREFDIKEWLAPAHICLCKRDAVLTTEEARKLGVDSVLLIWSQREKYRHPNKELNPGDDYCGKCFGLSDHGKSNTCKHCNSSSAYYRCTGPSAVRGQPAVDDAQIELEVTKWVENGC